MTRNEIKKITIDVLSNHLGIPPQKITEKSSFMDDLGGDSLDMVELTMAVEEAFNIEIEEKQIENILTVGQMIDFIITLNPDKTDYMKSVIQLKMLKNKSKNTLLSKFKINHQNIFRKLKIKR